jgi:hypothetical protein
MKTKCFLTLLFGVAACGAQAQPGINLPLMPHSRAWHRQNLFDWDYWRFER